VRAALAVAATGWLALLLSAPALPVALAGVTYLFGALICHQLPDRSFHIDGAQLPVCARCIGIYAGTALATLSRLVPGSDPRTTRHRGLTPRVILIAGMVPTAVTVGLEAAAVWYPSNLVRALTGVVLGAAIAFVVSDALTTINYDQCAPPRPIAPPRPPTAI
jgi:uncharacterized membrane protein